MTGTARNLSDSLRYREAIMLFLMLSGQDDARARPFRQSQVDPHPDVRVGDWALGTSSRINFKFSTDLVSAQNIADAAGLPHAAVVQHRRALALGESLVVMTLDTFVDALAAKT